MANTIKLRRSATAGSVPTTGNLALGELAMNTADGKLFMKTDDGAGNINIAEIGAGSGGTSVTIASSPPSSPAAGDIYWDQDDGSAYIYYIDADSTAQWVPLTPLADTPVPGSNAYKIDDISSSFNGVLTDFTINVDGSAHEPTYVNATLISLGGVIQQPTTAYTISGSTISFATAPSSGIDFFGIDLAAALPIGTPNDGTVTTAKIADNAVTSAKIVDGTIVNADVNASAAIAGTKVSPDFGSQAITTTGIINANGKISFPLGAQAAPSIYFGSDTNTGVFSPAGDEVAITTGGTQRVTVDSSGNVGIGVSAPSAGKLVVTDSSNGGFGGSIVLENSNNSDTDKVGIAFRPNGSATTAIGSYGESRIIGEYDSGSTNGANNLQFWTHAGNGTVAERLRIDSSGRLLVGATSAAIGSRMDVHAGSDGSNIFGVTGADQSSEFLALGVTSSEAVLTAGNASSNGTSLVIRTANSSGVESERLRIDSSGRLLVGTSSGYGIASSGLAKFQVSSTGADIHASLTDWSVYNQGGVLAFGAARGGSAGNYTIVQNNDALGSLRFAGADGTDLQSQGALIAAFVDGTPGANDMPGRLVFSTTPDGASSPTERLRINSDGTTTFTSDATINSLTIGRGGGNVNGNSAFGYAALLSNTTGYNNTANGRQALYSNTTGIYNVATGHRALYSNTTGYNNTANGREALFYNTTGGSNTATGKDALRNNTAGIHNVANGYQALYSNTTGNYNTANGLNALYYNTTGGSNIGIGFNNSNGYNPVFNPTTENNRLVLGHTAITNAYVKVAWTVTSDERDKMNFAPVPYGLDFVNQLKPTAYQFKIDRDTETPNGGIRYGFKAQDILALEGDNPVIIDTEDADNLKYRGAHLVPVLVNAVQELTTMVKELQTEIAALKGA